MRGTIEHLVSIRHEIFEEALNFAMTNELKQFDSLCHEGDQFNFELNHLDNSDNMKLQLLVDLVKKVEETTNLLANLNRIDLDEFDL